VSCFVVLGTGLVVRLGLGVDWVGMGGGVYLPSAAANKEYQTGTVSPIPKTQPTNQPTTT